MVDINTEDGIMRDPGHILSTIPREVSRLIRCWHNMLDSSANHISIVVDKRPTVTFYTWMYHILQNVLFPWSAFGVRARAPTPNTNTIKTN